MQIDACEVTEIHPPHLPWHQLGQAITDILTQTAAALAEPGLAPAARHYLGQIAGEATWLAEMIEDFRRPAQPDLARPDMTGVIDDAVTIARLTWPGEVIATTPDGPVLCRLNRSALRRTVSNLLGNAMRAAGPSGAVTIQARRYQDMAMLSIRDTGPGFGKIPRGFGIGLAGVARIIRGVGGRVDTGNAAGGGARVILWLPQRHS